MTLTIEKKAGNNITMTNKQRSISCSSDNAAAELASFAGLDNAKAAELASFVSAFNMPAAFKLKI